MKRYTADYVYTLEGFAPIAGGFVEVEDDGTVIRCGLCDEPSAEAGYVPGAIIPGMVNAHCHVELSSMWKLFCKGTGMTGFIDQINELRDTTTREEKIAAISRRMEQMWDAGVSAMADISNCADSFAVKAASPMYTRTFLEVFGTEPQDCDAIMEDVAKLAGTARSFGLDAAPTPHSCYTMSPELLSASAKEGLKSGFLSFHSEESDEEEQMLRSGSGPLYDNRVAAGMSTPPVTGRSSLLYFIDRLRAVLPEPVEGNILLVHEVCLDQEGCDAVRAALPNAYVALCPLSNIFIHNALPPVELMRRNGMRITVGTDSLSSNDDLDMVGEIFCLQQNFPDVPLGEIFTWACLRGAEFLGKDDVLGSIEPGKKPGLVAVSNLSGDGRLTTASSSKRII